VMVFGTAQLVTEEADKAAALAAFVHSVVPHRNRDVRASENASTLSTEATTGARDLTAHPLPLHAC